MPMSQAAMDGIAANGNRWKHHITLRDLTLLLGALNTRRNDGGEEPTREEIEPIVDKMVVRLRTFITRRYESHGANDALGGDLERRADDLDCVSDCDIEEVNYAMGELYDSLDYWRILVN